MYEILAVKNGCLWFGFWSDVQRRLMTVTGEWWCRLHCCLSLTKHSHKPPMYINPKKPSYRQAFWTLIFDTSLFYQGTGILTKTIWF